MKPTGKKALRRTNTGIEGYFCGMEGLISITPYKELLFGEKSIYDFIKKDKKIDEDVIKYLKTENAYLMSPGIYPKMTQGTSIWTIFRQMEEKLIYFL